MPTNATQKTPAPPAPPDLNTEVANRLGDPFEHHYQGLLRTNDPLLLERASGSVQAMQIYRDLKRDGKVFSALQKRRNALIARPWAVEPVGHKDQAAVELVQTMLKSIGFDQVCRELLDALLMGFVPAEIVWQKRDGLIYPQRIVQRSQSRFVYVQTDPNQAPALHLLTRQNMLVGEAVPPYKFIVHRQDPQDDNPYGNGLGLQLFWPVFFKRKGIVSWNKLNERFGSPTPLGKYPNNATQPQKNTLLQALQALQNDGAIIIPEGMQVEFLESKLTGNITTQESLCNYMDNWISEVILSQETASKTGGTATAADERESVRLDLVQADADLLSDTLNRTLLAWFCELNGLPPCNVSRIITKAEDKKALSETDKNVASLGYQPTLARITEKYGEGWQPAPKQPPAQGQAQGPAPTNNFSEVGVGPRTYPSPPSPQSPPDPIDSIIASVKAEAGWQELIEPMVSPLQAAMDASAQANESAAQLLQRLSTILPAMDNHALTDALSKSAYLAHLIATAGADGTP